MNTVIKQGESFTITATPRDDQHREYDLNDGVWECWMGIYDADGNEYHAAQALDLTESAHAFQANVSASVTAALLPRKYIVAIKVKRTDSTPALAIESHQQLILQKGYIS